LIKLKRKMEL